MVVISKTCTEWCLSTHTFEQQNWYPLQSCKLHVKAEFTETCQLAAWCSATLSFQTGMDTPLLNYMCQKASRQINALKRISKLLSEQCRMHVYKSFVSANFN